MCADKEIKQIVKANTKKKAESFAVNRLLKEGYFMAAVKSCEEIKR